MTDPHTGMETKKKRLGGAYPGQRRPEHAPYTPPADAFGEGNTTTTAHFVAYGGGNALTLARPDGTSLGPASGGPAKEYIQGEPPLFGPLVIIIGEFFLLDSHAPLQSLSHAARWSQGG